MATAWHIQRNNQHVGPLSAQQLRELALAGKLQSDDLVRKGDSGEFLPASRIKNLFAPERATTRPTPSPPRLPSIVMSEEQATSELVEPVTGSEPVAASETWYKRLLPYLTTARGKLGDFGEQAKQAGELGKLVARRTQLQQHQLPQAFSALGAHIYAERKFAKEFPNHFAEIDEAISQQSELAGPGIPESKSENLTGRMKGFADGLLRRGKGAAIGLKVKSLHRKFGEAAYRQHGLQSGPADLVAAIENAEAEIREVQQKISDLEAAGQGRVLTPRRLLVSGVVATVLVGFIGLLSILPSSAPSGTSEGVTDAIAEAQEELLSDDYSSGPNGEEILVGGDGLESDWYFHYYLDDDGKNVLHGKSRVSVNGSTGWWQENLRNEGKLVLRLETYKDGRHKALYKHLSEDKFQVDEFMYLADGTAIHLRGIERVIPKEDRSGERFVTVERFRRILDTPSPEIDSYGGRELAVTVSSDGASRQPWWIDKTYNPSLQNVRCIATDDSLVIQFDVDTDKWYETQASWVFPLLIRLLDKNGEYLTHIRTSERFTGAYEAFDDYNQRYERQANVPNLPARNRLPKPVLLAPEGNQFIYQVNTRDLQHAAMAEIGFYEAKSAYNE